MSAASFLAFDGRNLRFYDDGEDDGYESYEPLPSGADGEFWRGRLRPIFAKLLRLPGEREPVPVVSLRFAGVFATTDEGESYRPIFSGLPRRQTAPEIRVPLYRDVLDFWQKDSVKRYLLGESIGTTICNV